MMTCDAHPGGSAIGNCRANNRVVRAAIEVVDRVERTEAAGADDRESALEAERLRERGGRSNDRRRDFGVQAGL